MTLRHKISKTTYLLRRFVLLTLFLAITGELARGQSTPITLVQHASKDVGVTTSSSLAFSTSNTAGNFIAVVIRAGRSGKTITVTDSLGNTYQSAVQMNITVDIPLGDTLAIFYAENIRSGANTVTVAYPGPGTTVRFAILEYSGVAASGSVDAAVAGQGFGISPNSGNLSTTADGDLLLAGIASAAERTFSPGNDYTIVDQVPAAPNTKLITEHRIQSIAGAASATATLNAPNAWGAVLAAFRAAGPISSPDLTLTKTHTGTFVRGQSGAIYALTASNTGTGATSGTVAVTDTLPSGLTATALAGSGWTCTLATVSCTRSDVLLSGTSYPAMTLTVTVASNAPASITNIASVSGGGESNTSNNLASDVTPIANDTEPPSVPGGLTATPLSESQINLSWSNSTDNIGVTEYLLERCEGVGCSSTFAPLTPTSIPAFSDTGLNAATSYNYRVRATDGAGNWSPYSSIVTASTLPASQPSPITLVQHEGKDAGTTNSSTLAFPSANIAGNWLAVLVRVGLPDAGVTISDTRGNTYREAVKYTETVDRVTLGIYYAENIAGGANTVTVTSSISGGILRFAIFEYAGVATSGSLDATKTAQGVGASLSTGTFTTTADGTLVLGMFSTANNRTFTAGAGFTIRENVPPAPFTKLMVEDLRQASAGSIAATATLNFNDPWGAAAAAFRAAGPPPPPPPADLTLTKTHAGPFAQGQTGATYTLTVTNIAAGPTTGPVTVTDALPNGLTATDMTGNGWTCTVATLSCTRSDTLPPASSYPTITLTVNVAGNAPSSVTNTAAVSGGGETNTGNNAAIDVTMITVPDNTPPSAPGLLVGSAPDGTHVDLTWGPAQDNVGVTGYRVERCDWVCTVENGGFVKLETLAATSFSDSGLVPNTTYSYVVRAEDAANNLGPYSNVVTVTTLATIPELVLALSFDEGAGTTASDGSGKGNNGTLDNATWSATGKYGEALSFNGSNAKVVVPDALTLHLTTAMTLEAWVNPSVVSSAWRDIIQKGNDNYFLMGTTTFGGAPGGGGIFGGVNVSFAATSPLPTNTWSHLATTYDGATLRLYVNGVQVSSRSQTGLIAISNGALEIGGDVTFGQYFQGLIDEVRVYNVALTPTQIQTDMNSPVGTAFPTAILSTNNMNFGSVGTGSGGAPQSATLTNTGSIALLIAGITVTGIHSSDFSQTNNCGVSLASNTSCSITVTFQPGAAGPRNASLRIDDNAAGSPQTIALTGTGVGFSILPRVSVLTPILLQPFSVTGGSGGSLVWSVDGVPGGTPATGTISGSGVYTPPAVAGTHTVTVTEGANSSSATVYVSTYPGMFTHHNDNFRTGQNLSETVLTPSNVNPATFGKLFTYNLDGLSIASPLYVAAVTIPGQGVHNVVYVTTEHNSVYAFDADGLSPTPLWHKNFLGPGVTTVPAADTGECCDISPEIGITGTPVIDPATNTLYVVAKTKEGSNYFQRLHALDLGTGSEKFGGPVTIQATVPGTGNGSSGGQLPFHPLRQNQRPALLLSNGIVYVAFGAHGDVQPYHGWVLGYDVATLQQTMAFNVSPNADGGGIWQANGGPAVDEAGNIYFVTGNGNFSANGRNYGDSFVKISPSGTVLDYFTPWDESAINAADFDLGAAGPLLLPDQPGPHPRLMVSAGKNNTIYLVDRDSMGHKNNQNNDNQIVQSLVNIFPFGTPEPGNYSAAVYYKQRVYFGPIADNIQAFQLTNGLLSTTAVARSLEVFKYPGATMAISANQANNGILWAIQRNGDCGVHLSCPSAGPGVLRAYDASSSGNVLTQLYASDQAGSRDTLDFATKFSVPLVANGKVYVASMSRLTIFGLLP